MEACEVLARWVENPLTFKYVSKLGEYTFEIDGKEVEESLYIDTEKTIADVVAAVVREIAKELLNEEVCCEYDADIGNYIDVRALQSDKVLFSVKVADVEEYKGDVTGYKAVWRPLKEIIKDTVEAVKGYKSAQ